MRDFAEFLFSFAIRTGSASSRRHLGRRADRPRGTSLTDGHRRAFSSPPPAGTAAEGQAVGRGGPARLGERPRAGVTVGHHRVTCSLPGPTAGVGQGPWGAAASPGSCGCVRGPRQNHGAAAVGERAGTSTASPRGDQALRLPLAPLQLQGGKNPVLR